MSRKDYVKIAATLRQQQDTATKLGLAQTVEATDTIAKALCVVLADDNPSFDHTRFLAACGVES